MALRCLRDSRFAWTAAGRGLPLDMARSSEPEVPQHQQPAGAPVNSVPLMLAARSLRRSSAVPAARRAAAARATAAG